MKSKVDLNVVKMVMLQDVDRMMAMWQDPHVYMYQDKDFPERRLMRHFGVVFLIGPTSRNQIVTMNHRKDSVHYLRSFGFKGAIFVPENRGGYGHSQGSGLADDFDAPKWETDRWLKDAPEMHGVNIVLLDWIPRNEHECLGLNTNWEGGHQTGGVDHGAPHENIFVGYPKPSYRMKLPEHYLSRMEKMGWNRSTHFSYDQADLCKKVCIQLGAHRSSYVDDDIPI